MFWLWWTAIFVPVVLILAFTGAPEKIMIPVVVGGAGIFIFAEIKSIFGAFGSSNTFFGEGKKASNILANGKTAVATIISLDENSKGGVVTINDQPLLNLKILVEDGQAPAYEVSFDTIIPRSAVPQFQPGGEFKVKIDPADPQKVVIDVDAMAEQPVIGKKNWTDEDRKLLKEQGIDGVAKLLSVEDTGRSENFEPVIKETWEVKCAKWGTYTTTTEFAVASAIAERLKSLVGKSFSTRILPDNKDRMSVDIKFWA
ncbi:MAG: hypothetical protein WCT39_05500 [Candidatus Margulisiibacteriota bacterium]